jgi:hypothetical protein
MQQGLLSRGSLHLRRDAVRQSDSSDPQLEGALGSLRDLENGGWGSKEEELMAPRVEEDGAGAR